MISILKNHCFVVILIFKITKLGDFAHSCTIQDMINWMERSTLQQNHYLGDESTKVL